MPFAFSQDMTTGRDMYTGLSDKIGNEAPKGLIVHLAFESSTGVRIVDVWESEEAFERFAKERLRPAMDNMLQAAGVTRESLGVPHEEDLTPIEIFGTNIPKRRLS